MRSKKVMAFRKAFADLCTSNGCAMGAHQMDVPWVHIKWMCQRCVGIRWMYYCLLEDILTLFRACYVFSHDPYVARDNILSANFRVGKLL